MYYDWRFDRLVEYLPAFISGTWTTIALTGISIMLGTLLGVVTYVFVCRSRSAIATVGLLVDVIRAVPPLVVVLFFYYFLTKPIVGFSLDPYWVAVTALSVNLAAFVFDLVRAGVESTPKDLFESGQVLSMTDTQIAIHLVAPHVVRISLPGAVAIFIGILKTSSLSSIINVSEVVYVAQTIVSTIARSLEAWCVVSLIYVVLVLPGTMIARHIERRLMRRQHVRGNRGPLL